MSPGFLVYIVLTFYIIYISQNWVLSCFICYMFALLFTLYMICLVCLLFSLLLSFLKLGYLVIRGQDKKPSNKKNIVFAKIRRLNKAILLQAKKKTMVLTFNRHNAFWKILLPKLNRWQCSLLTKCKRTSLNYFRSKVLLVYKTKLMTKRKFKQSLAETNQHTNQGEPLQYTDNHLLALIN